jgi:hypothetical protein
LLTLLFHFAVVIILLLSMTPNQWHKQALPPIPSILMMEIRLDEKLEAR